ncbi:MAG: ABC transporter substrate-binding protein [Anaerolineae bacterium]|nr:ABC transporter substrate-binding protein [Anaerolineae bacterium]
MIRLRMARSRSNMLILPALVASFLAACGGMEPPKTYTIGVVSYVSILEPVIEGFKTGMADLGYVEGENVIYIYNGVLGSELQVIDAEIESLLAQDVDLLFPVGNLAALQTKQAVAGTDMPVVFGAVSNPVEGGIVAGIAHPGGNLTGVQNGTETAAALEWLVRITPGADKVYLPYNPSDPVAMIGIAMLEGVPEQLGIELVLDEVGSTDEAVAAIESLPDDIDAIFALPSPTITGGEDSDKLIRAAIGRRLPMGSSAPSNAMLITLTADLFEVGKQTARMANQVLQGSKPADLPVETAEFYLTINLKRAEAIGLYIPDDILEQADNIVR